MPNANYEKGRRFEYVRMKFYREQGNEHVMRTAGSHGAFDIVVITPSGEVEFIQCKVVKSPAEANRLINAFKNDPPIPPYNLPPRVHQVLEIKIEGSTLVQQVVT